MRVRTTAKYNGKALVVDVQQDGTIRINEERRRTGYTIPAAKLYEYLVVRKRQGLSGTAAPLDESVRGKVLRVEGRDKPVVYARLADVKYRVGKYAHHGVWTGVIWVDVAPWYFQLGRAERGSREEVLVAVDEFMGSLQERYEFQE